MTRRLVARCVRGLEWCCADEITASVPAATGVVLSRRQVSFDVPALTAPLAGLRTVDDLFVEVGRVDSGPRDKLAATDLVRRLVALPWRGTAAAISELALDGGAPGGLDVVATLGVRRNYNRFAVENGLGESLERLLPGRYLARGPAGRAAGEVGTGVRVLVGEQTTTAALRLTREPLHRRSWKLDTGPGTLHPPVAAAMARLATSSCAVPSVPSVPSAPSGGGGARLLDPFCGDGTVVVEAGSAGAALDLVGSDADPERVRNARANAGRAGVPARFEVADAGRSEPGEPVDLVVTNPPWDVAIEASGSLRGSLAAWWGRLPALVAAGGRVVTLTSAELDGPAALTSSGLVVADRSRLRLAGRLCDLVVSAHEPLTAEQALGPAAAAWRDVLDRTDARA